ncbi:MAG TPA: ATP-binding protein [Cyanothece sp. UBA12306]|nr:ATP-binding protein [Cyanothece sp. UBA12306]
MDKIFGDFLENFIPDQDCLQIIFTPTSTPIKKRWKNNRLSAHFIADYFASFLPIDLHDSKYTERVNNSKNAVSYIVNELLENAMKYNDELSNYKIKIGINFLKDQDLKAVIFCQNSIKYKAVDSFQKYLQELLLCDLEAHYISAIEKNATDPNSENSGLGLLTIINDYSARMGWKFETVLDNPKIITVTTMAQIIV